MILLVIEQFSILLVVIIKMYSQFGNFLFVYLFWLLIQVSLVYGNYAEAKLNTDGSHVENYDNIIMTVRTIIDAFFGVWDYWLTDNY